ncbi:MAG TPA: VWA domain-containing protein [Candidatus Sulfotelmatobacter sp.]|nr:VWA domain-containing protein [Candidatus Sulfotelmatobacter sp.]
MRFFSSLSVIFILHAWCRPVVAQEPTVVRVGVTVPQSGDQAVSAIEVRDRLVKALNQQRPDKKLRLSGDAVALETEWGSKAITEAKEKNCPFVLSTQLTGLHTSSILRPTTTDESELHTVPVFDVTVEYRLTRVIDGATFAIGSAQAKDTTSLQEVVWRTLAQVAGKALVDIAKAGVPRGESRTAENSTEKLNSAQAEAPRIAANLCAWLPTGIPHSDALPRACDYVMSLPETMPNFICHQEASRYRGKSRAPTDLITASVRYEDGRESYGEIKVNGKPETLAVAQATGLWSTGEFGSNNLRSIFNPRNQPVFDFAREGTLGEHAAWIFTYKIAKQNEPLWRLHGEDQVVAPPYEGELWIDQKTGSVVRFESIAEELPANFVLSRAEIQIDYEDVRFADGSEFTLPSSFAVSTNLRGGQATRNVVRLTDFHKFRAKGRLVLNAGSNPSASVPAAQVPPSAAAVRKDLQESEAIFSAIRDQAVQEDEARQEAEQAQVLNGATAPILERLSQLRGEQRQIQAQHQTIAVANAEGKNAAADAGSPPRTALKVEVRLVPVSVVLRDGKGHAVGNLGQENFRLFDNGKPQVITQFSVEASVPGIPAQGAEAVSTQETMQLVTNQNRPAGTERNTAYLFDDAHSNLAEMAGAREAAVRHLGALKAGERAAVFTTSGAVVIDFTDDQEKLLAGVRKLRPHEINSEFDCPPISYYIADLMINKRDPEAESVAVAEVMECAFQGASPSPLAQRMATAKAVEVLDSGNAESKNAIETLSRVIRRTESMPGQRSIVVVSPGFLALTPDLLEVVMALVEGAVRAGIIVNSLDPHGLYTAGVSGKSSLPGRNRFLLANAEAQALGDVMAEFSTGTGGIFFHNNNDLDEGFRRTASAPEFVYVLGFSPQKLDGKFHKLKVSLDGAEKYEVQARLGYYAPKAARPK